jgi:lysozyme
MVSEELVDNIKEHEGFIGKPYRDHLGFLTIGFGTLIERGITREEGTALLKIRLNDTINQILKIQPVTYELTAERQDVLFEMGYQLGVTGIMKFKKMWAALEDADYREAAAQMLDSKWYTQTPNRAKKLAARMERG